MPTVAELGQKVKAKYPGSYDDLSDVDVGNKVKTKFPGAYDDFTDPVPEKKTINTQSDTPVIGQLSNFGIGVGSAIGRAGLGLGQAALKIGNVVGGKMGADTSMSEAAIEELEKVKDKVFTKPFEKSLETVSGTAGELTGTLAPYLQSGGAMSSASFAPRVAARTLLDTIVSQGQAGGSTDAAMTVTPTSLIANMITPSGGFITRTLKNLAPGYISDVTRGAVGERGEGRTGAAAFIPGAGTAFSGMLGMGSEALRLKSPPKNVTYGKRYKALETLEKSHAKVHIPIKRAMEDGVDVKKILSETDLLNGAVDKTGTISAENALANFDDIVKPYEGHVRKALEEEGTTVSLSAIREHLRKTVEKSKFAGAQKLRALKAIDSEINGLMVDSPEFANMEKLRAMGMAADDAVDMTVPLYKIHDSKVTRYEGINWLTEKSKANIDKLIARGLKEIVEENAQSVGVKTFNEELSKLYSVRDVLRALDKKKVEGGRLGKYFSQVVGGIAGGAVGGAPGAIVGAEVGGRVKGNQLSHALGGNVKEKLKPSERMLGAMRGGDAPTVPSTGAPRGGVKDIPNKQGGFVKNPFVSMFGPQKAAEQPTVRTASESVLRNMRMQLEHTGEDAINKALTRIDPNKIQSFDELAEQVLAIPGARDSQTVVNWLGTGKRDIFGEFGLPMGNKPLDYIDDLVEKMKAKPSLVKRAIERYKNIPNKQGGFARVPFTGNAKLAELQDNAERLRHLIMTEERFNKPGSAKANLYRRALANLEKEINKARLQR